jgi:hypothetical protein
MATILDGYCRKRARIWCKNCNTSCGREAEGGYIVGESKPGMTILWMLVGGELLILVVTSLMKRRNIDWLESMAVPRVV